MSFITHHKTLLIVGLGVLVAIGVWWGFSGNDRSAGSILVSQDRALNAEERGIVDTLLQLRTVSLSGAILSDPAFLQLRDFGTQIVPEPVGRENPFAPASLIEPTVSTTTPTSTTPSL